VALEQPLGDEVRVELAPGHLVGGAEVPMDAVEHVAVCAHTALELRGELRGALVEPVPLDPLLAPRERRARHDGGEHQERGQDEHRRAPTVGLHDHPDPIGGGRRPLKR
jgi:hypothetical protein